MSAVKALRFADYEEEPTPRLTVAHPDSAAKHPGLCLYCNLTVAGGAVLHEHCRRDYEWEQRMRAMNRNWRPS